MSEDSRYPYLFPYFKKVTLCFPSLSIMFTVKHRLNNCRNGFFSCTSDGRLKLKIYKELHIVQYF